MERKETITATVLLQKLGYQDTIDGLWWDRVQRWGEWYRGRTDFHRYSEIYNNHGVGDTTSIKNIVKYIAYTPTVEYAIVNQCNRGKNRKWIKIKNDTEKNDGLKEFFRRHECNSPTMI